MDRRVLNSYGTNSYGTNESAGFISARFFLTVRGASIPPHATKRGGKEGKRPRHKSVGMDSKVWCTHAQRHGRPGNGGSGPDRGREGTGEAVPASEAEAAKDSIRKGPRTQELQPCTDDRKENCQRKPLGAVDGPDKNHREDTRVSDASSQSIRNVKRYARHRDGT